MKCNDSRKCFARGERGNCIILLKTYLPGKCPFCKPDREWTGKKYCPLDFNYGQKGYFINGT